jgi:hypothetical protein
VYADNDLPEAKALDTRTAGASRWGAEAEQDVKDVGGGKPIASVKDADGNVTGLLQPA